RLEGRTPDRGVVGELEEDVTALAGFGRAYNPSVESVGPAVACGFDRAISEVCIGALIRHEQSCSLDRLALDPIGDRLYCFRIVAPDTVQDRSRSVRHTDRGSLPVVDGIPRRRIARICGREHRLVVHFSGRASPVSLAVGDVL